MAAARVGGEESKSCVSGGVDLRTNIGCDATRGGVHRLQSFGGEVASNRFEQRIGVGEMLVKVPVVESRTRAHRTFGHCACTVFGKQSKRCLDQGCATDGAPLLGGDTTVVASSRLPSTALSLRRP